MQTLEAIAVAVLGLMPGAAYLWSLESVVGGWWLGLVDRIHRFVYWSVVLHLVFAPLTYVLWTVYFRPAEGWDRGWTLVLLWLALWLYLIVPHAFGRRVGRAWKRGDRWARHIVGDASPAAWDHVWSTASGAWVRARLKGGGWIGGVFADPPDGRPGSYAAGHPNPQDLWLAVLAEVDPESGEWMLDGNGDVLLGEGGLLIRRDDVEILEITPEPLDTRSSVTE